LRMSAARAAAAAAVVAMAFTGAGSAPTRVAHEDAVLGGTLEDIIR
jgi:hypothetical protein